ncbi:MAG TPA: hypothetical protein VFU42_05185 [Candidatus Deferrimicrobiaceae bacterium]|nr:hypothetical protein [Candidatus Deferrimicrobiaceae bacterium]
MQYSERVIAPRWGRIVMFASTPTKMLLETESDSAPLIRRNRVNSLAKNRTRRGMTPTK